MDVATVDAPPGTACAPCKSYPRFDVVGQDAEGLLVLYFGNGNGVPGVGRAVVALLSGNRRKPWI